MGAKLPEGVKRGQYWWYMWRGWLIDESISPNKQRWADLMSNNKSGKVVFSCLFSSRWSEEHPELESSSSTSSSELPVWLICSLPALLFGHNSIPSLVCKTALSSQRGIWQQQIQSPGSQHYPQRPDLALLLRPVIKASCCLLHWSHQKWIPVLLCLL